MQLGINSRLQVMTDGREIKILLRFLHTTFSLETFFDLFSKNWNSESGKITKSMTIWTIMHNDSWKSTKTFTLHFRLPEPGKKSELGVVWDK